MKFDLSDEQRMMQKTVREFAEKEIRPIAGKLDKEETFPLEIIKKMGEIGLLGIPIPEEYGGAGMDFLSYVITIEELSRVFAAIGVILAVHTSVGTFPILNFGSEFQKEKFVKRLAAGEMIGAFALTEPLAGSDAASISTKAEKHGDKYLLNGSKVFITNAGFAGVYTVLAVTDKEKGHRGISAFLVTPDLPGFKIGPPEKKMGLHASSTCQLFFENAEIPAENLLGQEGEGFKIAMSLLDTGRIGVAAQSLGLAQSALDEAVKYTKGREQFGQAIANFQGVNFLLADMATRVEAAKMLVYRAASLKEQGKPHGKEASMAKMYSSDTAVWAANKSLQLHGGYGYTKEYPVERIFRDAKVLQIYEGTNEIQRLVIAKNLLK